MMNKQRRPVGEERREECADTRRHHLQQVIPLELELISMELVPTVAGQLWVAPREDEV